MQKCFTSPFSAEMFHTPKAILWKCFIPRRYFSENVSYPEAKCRKMFHTPKRILPGGYAEVKMNNP